MDQLQHTYPRAAELLEPLPYHVVERMGNTAMRLRHVDMHPIKEVQHEGKTTKVFDFDRVITDPEYQIEELSQEAVQAAHEGKQKLADVMNESAQALRGAYDELNREGYPFGPDHLEVEDEENKRERAEHDAIFSRASQHQIAIAKEAKTNGDTDASVKHLEALILLHSIRNTASRKSLRDAVRQGLAEELVTAARGADKLLTGQQIYRDRVSSSMADARNLLEVATGRRLDLRFNPASKAQITFLGEHTEDYKDYMAAIAAPGSAVGIEQGFKNAAMNQAFNQAAKFYNPEAKPGEIGSAEYLDATFEQHQDWNSLSDALGSNDPRLVLELANRLDTSGIQLLRVIGDYDSSSGIVNLNQAAIDNLLAIAHDFPELASLVANNNYIAARSKKMAQALGEIRSGFALLKEVGIDDPRIASKVITSPKPLKAATNFHTIALNLRQQDYERPLADALLNGLAASSINKSLDGKIDPEIAAKQIALSLNIYHAYLGMYKAEHYGKDADPPTMSAEQLPSLVKTLTTIGIPEAVSNAMVQSWCTYNHMRVVNDSMSGKIGSTDNIQPMLESISISQVDAISKHLGILGKLIIEHGLETTTEIIQTFGIYNFGRHSPDALVDQLERWKAGDKIKTVVVDPRSDWNSYTGRHHEFDEEVSDGIFYFEAGSGQQVSKIAVRVGQHERQNGREPDVSRFVIHGHGNPKGITLGANGEGIDLVDYAYAAFKLRRLPKAEGNDYRRHLGSNFSIIFMSCSTAGQNGGAKSIAQASADWHKLEDIKAADRPIAGLIIRADGSVAFKLLNEKDGVLEPTTLSGNN